jgi:iron(III) transport system permease protein
LGLLALAGGLALLLVAPLGWLLPPLFGVGERAVELALSDSTFRVLSNSVTLVGVVTLGTVVVGVPLAVLTVQTDLPFRRFWTVVAALPLVVPSYIGAFAFISAFGPQGELAGLLAPLGVERLPTVYGLPGAALVLTLYTYPYVFLTTRASLLSLDPSLVEAARTLDCSRAEAFRRVTLPRIVPGITAGALLSGLYTLADFGTPNFMRVSVFTQRIYTEIRAPGGDGYAALLSIQLLALTALFLYAENRIGADDSGAYESRGPRGDALAFSLGRLKWPALCFAALVAALALVVPVGILFHWLLRDSAAYASVGGGFELAHVWRSVSVSVAAALVGSLVALPVAYLSATGRGPLSTVIERLTYVGYAVPGIVLGFALIVATLSVDAVNFLYQTVPLLVFAYVVRFVPQSVGTVRSSLLQVDSTLTEAARTLGRTPTGAFRAVVLPLIAPGVAAGAALVFLTSMKELPATLLLSPTGFETLVTYVWTVREAGYYGQAAVPALVLVGVSTLSMAVILRREGNHG